MITELGALGIPLRQASGRLRFSNLGVESENNVRDEQEKLYG